MLFNTIFGRNLLAELAPTVNSPYLLVTMPDLWPLFEDQLKDGNLHVHLVESIEREDLEVVLAGLPDVDAVVGMGGGMAVDVAKYVAWRRRLPLFQVPTAMSVNAPFAHRAAVREHGVIKYVGWTVPEAVYVDYDIIQNAPMHLNRTGVGDIFCYHTAHADWRLAAETGHCEKRWPLDERQIDEATNVMMSCAEAAEDIRSCTEHGIRTLMTALRWGGAAFANNGWNPRPIEGSEHTFFYSLEYLTKKHFLHGQPVGLGTLLMSALQDNRADWMKSIMDACGVPYRPADMGVTWDEVAQALRAMPSYAEEAGLWYTAAVHIPVTDEYIERMKDWLR
jgi:glycerol-1-phosphate dehydrogenase [NAD(P)+]